ncbi:MAG: chorismate mutase [Oscillospiraceae bacterium]|nr:chorismate mutase [Oscillospiraceae bacterium]
MNKTIPQLREEIDALDEKLVALFSERMSLSRQIAAEKAALSLPIRDERRESELTARIRALAGEALADQAETLYRCILTLSREEQAAAAGQGRAEP